MEFKTIHKLFERQAAIRPDAPAIESLGEVLTYSELNRRANIVAAQLRKLGVNAEARVCILADSSIGTIVAIMGILKSGGGYVVIDPKVPLERIQYILGDCNGCALVTEVKFAVSVIFTGNLIVLDEISNQGGQENYLEGDVAEDGIAYIVYTSGSSGAPKGVVIEHHSISLYVSNVHKRLEIIDGLHYATVSTFAADLVNTTLFLSITTGGILHILSDADLSEGARFLDAVKTKQIDFLKITPSLFRVLLEGQEDVTLPMRWLIFGGERFDGEFVGRVLKANENLRLFNHYGPTEATVGVVVGGFDEIAEFGSLGFPLPSADVWILDINLRIAADGIIGELCIGGEQLARGYLNRPDLTAERFVANPFEEGGRLYRTGDLARWLPDGTIEFMGRMDDQVKIRGYRVELGEVESVLQGHPGVAAAVVRAVGKDGEKSLCAYYVERDAVGVEELREYLRLKLPGYMVPAYFSRLERLPLTANGKVDRKALPEPEAGEGRGEYEAPRDEAEQRLAKVFEEVLKVERVGIGDNFFDLGGHSLKAIQLVAQTRKALDVELELRELFDNPTVRDLADIVRGRRKLNYERIPRAPQRLWYPVSSAQKRMYALQQLEGGVAYNVPAAYLLKGELDMGKVEAAVAAVIAKHEAFRTRFELVEGEVVQRIEPRIDFKIEYEERAEAEVAEVMRLFVKPFDLGAAPLMRLKVVKRAADEHVLCVDMHHVISDLVASAIVMRDFTRAYKGEALGELEIQYKDYAVWQKERLAGEYGRLQEAYWLKEFSGEVPVLNLPTDFPRPAVQSFEGSRHVFEWDAKLTAEVNDFCSREGVTTFMFLLAAYQVLLAKYSGQEDIVVGTPVIGRDRPDLEEVVGIFINTLALRSTPKAGKQFSEYLKEVRQLVVEGMEHQGYPFEELVEKVEVVRDLSRNPLFSTMFIFGNALERSEKMGLVDAEAQSFSSGVVKFDLSLNVQEGAEGLLITAEYCTQLFKLETIERLGRHYERVVRELVKGPQRRLGEIEIVEGGERAKLVDEFNRTSVEYPRDRCVHELFEEQAAARPEAIAVEYEGEKLTYGELNARANRLARRLRLEGVGADSLVGILVERSLDMMVGILGILKAGGAYVPIDPEYPEERISYMLKDSGCEVLVAQMKYLLGLAYPGRVIVLEGQEEAQGDGENLVALSGPMNLAYVIYTSGSTGAPKGVMVSHNGVVRLVRGQTIISFCSSDIVLQLAPITFDAATLEIWATLLNGGKLMIYSANFISLQHVGDFIFKNGISVIWLTAGVFSQMIDQHGTYLSKLRLLIAGGDVLSIAHVKKAASILGDSHVINGYGPTESTTFTCCYLIKAGYFYDSSIPIGGPINSTHVYILDRSLKLVPIGMAGELCIAGDGLARGYLNRPDLTAERFVANPFEEGGRLYRTGDLARWLPDGTIEFMGRMDDQVKIRGYRVELGEVESVLQGHPGVAAAVVRAVGKDGEKSLCAYYVERDAVGVEELREYLRLKLPGYMVPAYFSRLERLPLTANGKVDRKALPEPEAGEGRGEYEAPRDEAEQRLAKVFEEVLKVERVGIGDNFFDLGGHSLKAIQLVAQINSIFKCQITLIELIRFPTIKEIIGNSELRTVGKEHLQ